MKISIITVTWNNEAQIISQMASVASHMGSYLFEQIIIDNGSKDNTVKKIEEEVQKGNFPHVALIKNNENKGFSAANNQGMNIATGEYIIFLNPDMVVTEGSFSDMVNRMQEEKNLVIASPKLVTSSGERNDEALPRKFPSVLMLVFFILKLGRLFHWYANKHYYMPEFDIEKEAQVDSVRGACMVVKRKFLDELGFGFDPRYFIWFEDVDVCKEAYDRGYYVKHIPAMTITDLIGRSFSQRTSMWRYMHFTDSLLVYVKKWHGRSAYAMLSLLRTMITPYIWIITKMQK